MVEFDSMVASERCIVSAQVRVNLTIAGAPFSLAVSQRLLHPESVA
jgi:hypothetical protein